MSFGTFRKCIDLYALCDNEYPLFMHNFGEPLLHPELPDFIAYATSRDVEVSFFTNGLRPGGKPYSREDWSALKARGLKRVGFSAHGMTIEDFMEKTRDIVDVLAVWDPHGSPRDTWAGQVSEALEGVSVDCPPVPEICIFERENAFVVLWDGRIASCCIDVEGRGTDLTVDDLIARQTYRFHGNPLCDGCDCYVEKRL